MKEYYSVEDIMALLNKPRTNVRRIIEENQFKVEKVKVGRNYKNMYLKEDVDNFLNPQKVTVKPLTRTVHIPVPKAVDELPEWKQKIAWARYILCGKLRDEYDEQKGLENKEITIKRFVEDVPNKYPNQFKAINGKLSVSTLRKWYAEFLKNPSDPLNLSTKNGAKKGKRNIPEDVLTMIRTLYKSRNKPTMMFVYERVVAKFGNVITYDTLRTYINKDMNVIEKAKGRMGDKEFRDKHSIYTKRDYSKLKPNEYWVSDGHDLELMCYKKDEKVKGDKRYFGSPKMMVWMDVKSRYVVSWSLTWTETTESIALTLKKGIEKYGIPENVYTDNGKAYKSKVLKGTEELDGIYESLGIGVTHTLPYSGQSKHIERWFKVFKESFAKDSITYKGGSIAERPERLGSFALEKIDKGAILEEDELVAAIDAWVEYANHGYYKLRGGHRGQGMDGKTPKEVYTEYLDKTDRKMLSNEKLRLLFMYEEIRSIGRNGITFLSETYSHENLYFRQGEKVKIKYDPHNLKEVLVYAITGEFICQAERLSLYGFNDIEGVKNKKKRLKNISKTTKKLVDLREEEREESGLLEYKENFRRSTENLEAIDYNVAIEKSNKRKVVSIGNGIELVID